MTKLILIVEDDQNQREMLEFTLKKYEGRMSEVAIRLGIGRSTLYRKVAEFDLEKAGLERDVKKKGT